MPLQVNKPFDVTKIFGHKITLLKSFINETFSPLIASHSLPVASRSAVLRPVIANLAPSSANFIAVPLPMPELAPATAIQMNKY
jgi:hypothetical protein